MGPRSFRDLTTKKPGPLVIILSGRSLPSMESMVMVHGMQGVLQRRGDEWGCASCTVSNTSASVLSKWYKQPFLVSVQKSLLCHNFTFRNCRKVMNHLLFCCDYQVKDEEQKLEQRPWSCPWGADFWKWMQKNNREESSFSGKTCFHWPISFPFDVQFSRGSLFWTWYYLPNRMLPSFERNCWTTLF